MDSQVLRPMMWLQVRLLCCACDQETVNLQDGEAQMRMHSVASNGKLRLRRQRPQKELCKKQLSFLLNTPLEPLHGSSTLSHDTETSEASPHILNA